MRTRKYASWICGLASAAALVFPAANALADASSPVTCKDGTTSPHGGRGSCSGLGGIDKAATAAAAGLGSTEPSGSGAPAPTPAVKPASAAPTPAPTPPASAGTAAPSTAV